MAGLLGMFDVDDMRALLATVNFVIFVGILFWVYGRNSMRKIKDFEDAANLPFRNEDTEKTIERVKI